MSTSLKPNDTDWVVLLPCVNCLDAVRAVPSSPVQCRVMVPVTFSLIELLPRLVVIASDTSPVAPAWVNVPPACVLTVRS